MKRAAVTGRRSFVYVAGRAALAHRTFAEWFNAAPVLADLTAQYRAAHPIAARAAS